MPLVLETGAGVPGANTFALVADADAWFTALGNSDWVALPVGFKERDLILGSLYVSNQQIYPYSGAPAVFGQGLAWPRVRAYYRGSLSVPENLVPPEVIRASIVAAGLASTGSLPVQTAAIGVSEVKKEKVDVLEIEYFHSLEGSGHKVSGANSVARFGHPDVTGLLAPLLEQELVNPMPTAVGRSAAARRSASYTPSSTPPAFHRGMYDTTPMAEDAATTRRFDK